jgi:hypothetical protein
MYNRQRLILVSHRLSRASDRAIEAIHILAGQQLAASSVMSIVA